MGSTFVIGTRVLGGNKYHILPERSGMWGKKGQKQVCPKGKRT